MGPSGLTSKWSRRFQVCGNMSPRSAANFRRWADETMQLNLVGRSIAVACAVVLSASAASCERRTGVPDVGPLLGTWVLTAESLTLARAKGFAMASAGDHQIVLSPEGNCQFRSYWSFDSATGPREDDYIQKSDECSWRAVSADVAARRWGVVGAIELSVWERAPGRIPRAAGVDLQIEQVDDRLYLLATSGHPDENGPRFLYEAVAQ